MPRTAMHSRRTRTSCSILALATVMAVGATPAGAQSLLGTGTFVNPAHGSIDQTVVGQTTVSLNSGVTQAVINWIPTDNATGTTANIVFQNAGTTALFSGSSNFAVLNNINSASVNRAIEMNGTVNARVSGVQRGSVYFYAPGGFVFGGGSVFSVGSLVVSALPIMTSGSTFITNFGTDNTVVFGQALNASASIVSNGTINANFVPFGVGSAGTSYVAMIAPRVVHNGALTVNGSAALVGAEAATISFSPDGLFDIQVTVGTTSSSGVEVSGDIGGETPTSVTDQHRIYLAAVPKNDALTMVIANGADLGFTLANNASIDQYGAVVLSAGHDIANGAIGAESAAPGTGTADFSFTGAHATNNLFGEATGSAFLFSASPNLTTTFDSNVTVHARNNVSMSSSSLGGALTVGGNLSLSADRTAAAGGSATAGNVSLFAQDGGNLSVAGTIDLSADGTGGDVSSGTAGSGTGGTVSISANGGSTLTLGNLTISAKGTGGDGVEPGANGGTGTGGMLNVSAGGGGTLVMNNALVLDAQGTGGTATGAGTAGSGVGGEINITANAGSTVDFNGFVSALASGNGGEYDFGVNGGNGTGGEINVNANGSNGKIFFDQGADLFADGNASVVGSDCLSCSALGGNGLGGTVTFSGTSGGLIDGTGNLELSATGSGGSGGTGAAGNGTGGTVLVYAPTGMTIDVTGSLVLNASGDGGISEAGLAAGNGTGNSARLHVDGGSVTVTGELELDADGFGGESQGGGAGGDGTGGRAEVVTTGATAQLNVLGNVLIEADGLGGDSSNNEGPLGAGGDGFGGKTRIVASDGNIHITGNLVMDATSTGGSGATGGNAAGVTTPSNNEGLEPAAFLWAGASTAELRVDGLTDIDVSATGGQGFAGNGGTASGGEVDIVSQLGDVNLGNVIGNAEALGGDGGAGGAGGNATGGNIDVSWSLIAGALTGTIAADAVTFSASGEGGAGGDGTNANTGGNGGAGGAGTGGRVNLHGNAAGGTLVLGATTIAANGLGGAGGDGGSGDTGTGGNGGAGGAATGGFIFSGTISSESNPGSGGSVTLTTLSQSASATGGAGGNGGEGGGGLGTGGNGGAAIGGESYFLVRGVPVTANIISLTANATGGNGGFGSTNGNGGNASTGFIAVESKDRFGHPTQRGTLTANSITGTATAQGGTGAANGTSTVRGGNYFRVLNGDANIGSLSFTIAGSLYDGTLGPDYIQAQDGAATIGTFSYSTTGQLAIYTTSTGSLNVGNLSLSAGNFIDHPTLSGPVTPGTIFATNLSVTSGGNFIADANLDVDNGIDVTVPGSIRFDNAVTSSFVDLWAQGGSVDLDNITADGDVFLNANGLIDIGIVQAGYFDATAGSTFTSNNITSDADIRINAGDDVTLGHLVAGLPAGESSKAIRIDTDGSVLVGNMLAAGGIDVTAVGSVTGLNVTTGDGLFTDADGAIVYQNISAGLVNPQPPSEPFAVGLDSATSITVGNVDATRPIGFVTSGSLTTGNLTTDSDVLGLADGTMIIGNINADGRVLLADSSMFTNAGGTIGGQDDDGADIEAIFASTPVATSSSITVANVTAGTFRAAPGTFFSSGDITTDGLLAINAGTNVTGDDFTAGDISSPAAIDITAGGNIGLGDVTSGGSIDLGAGGSISTDDLFAYGSITVDAGGAVDLGNVTTEDPPLLLLAEGGGITTQSHSSGPSVEIYSDSSVTTLDIGSAEDVIIHAGGNILTGIIDADRDITLATPGTITTDDIFAVGMFMAFGHGNMSFGNATASDVLLADYAMLTSGGVSATCVGNCGTLGPNGVVTAPPGGSDYFYVTTDGGLPGEGQLAGQGGIGAPTNGSLYTTTEFSADAGDAVEFWFNYVTSDGAGFADYSWAALYTADLDPVAVLFTARTRPDGTIVPGQDLPGVEATLNPASVPIIGGAPVWDPLGGSSGTCFSAGCGFTGWVNSTYEITASGNYVLRFGVTNWNDGSYQSGMAFSGITVGGNVVSPGLTRSGGSITIGNVNTGNFTAAAGTTLTTGNIAAVSDIKAESGGAMTLAPLGTIAGNDIELDSDGNITFGTVNAGTEIDFDGGGNVTGGNIVAGNQISGSAGGTINLGNLTVGGPVTEGENFSIGMTAEGNITVQDVSGSGPVGFGTQANLTTGDIEAGGLFMALVGGNTTINGSITTNGENSQVYIADDSMCETGGGCSDDGGDDFNPDAVLALAPVATGGSITINGPVSTGLFRAAAGTGLTTQAITATDIQASAGGTATINGLWSTEESVLLSSNDIDIAATGGIDAGFFLTLVSTNGTQMLIGDGLTGTGYRLSNAEFGRISGHEVELIGRSDASAAIDMLIGDLNVTGPLAGSNVEGSDLVFATGDLGEGSASGVIRVVGDVNATGFGIDADQSIEFHTGRFELDAATGSISIFSSGTTLGGELGIYADRIHVAAGPILNQLASNPTYTNYQQDLNEEADVQRPEGVLRADTIWIESDNLQDILIQNVGKFDAPAGFLARQLFVNDDNEVAGPPGSINLVVNGQLVTEGGTLTSVAARDALVPEGTDITPFTANSTINGCALTGPCVPVPPPPPRAPGLVDSQIDLIGGDAFGEDNLEDTQEGDEGSNNPISPPQPLFDTRPLIPTGDVNDPVSGTGNPALLGSDQCDQEEQGQCPAKGDNQ